MFGSSTMVRHQGGMTTLNMPNGGTRVIDDRTGEGFHISVSGERLSIADGLDCACGPEFTRYVRFYLDSFPYHHMGPSNRDIDNLWIGRKLKLKLPLFGKNMKGEEVSVNAAVVSWEEWNTGPYSDRTEWAVIVRVERNGSNTFNAGDLVKYKDNMAIITNVDDRFTVIKCDYHTSQEVERDSLEIIEQLRFYVEKMDVLNEGRLSISDKFVSNDDEIAFEWIDPPSPYLDKTCGHGILELIDSTTLEGMYQKVKEYIKQHVDGLQSNPLSTPEHITETVIAFLEKEPELISESFCKFVWTMCIEAYFELTLNGTGSKDILLGCIILATNLKYRYLPEKNGEQIAINKISKYMRDIFSERGIARVLVKELSCDCTDDLKRISKRMENIGTCFGCRSQEKKSALLECSRCRFARYCGKDCQASDWDKHKKACKAIRKQTNM
ncbi:hypothetical protein CTEN210_12889 [Chaetoceros tenuissimus]|uniref:MYND-type domain-containing protein n=1 Tax=Chaetoceros tenuissimus TaxID=426638 RepID=A0AAD3D2E5_9STRA|nr:hypothetical protein CTEN210_12889 [Chaetoceros tenuissimus]